MAAERAYRAAHPELARELATTGEGEAETLADEEEDWEADDPDAPPRGRLNILGVLDAMSERYHEHRTEMLERWTWPFFCAQWARMMDWVRAEERRREGRETRARLRRQQAAAERALAANRAGMLGVGE